MAKKRKRNRQPARRSAAAEDRRAEVVTVAWMLTMMTTLGAELVGAILRLAAIRIEAAATSLVTFSNLMLFTAAITGLLCLSLTPIVYRVRRTPPPAAVTALAVTASALPLAIGILHLLR